MLFARAVGDRLVAYFSSPVFAGVCATVVALGAILYIGMLLVSFDMGLRLRDASLGLARESEDVKRMEVRERERDAQFAVRHRAFLDGMEEITALRYLAPGSTAVSEAPRSAAARP